MVKLLKSHPSDEVHVGIFPGRRRTFNELVRRGFLVVCHPRDGSRPIKVTRRGMAAINGEDVR